MVVLGKVYAGSGRFPGGQFAFPAWLDVLRDVGLVSGGCLQWRGVQSVICRCVGWQWGHSS